MRKIICVLLTLVLITVSSCGGYDSDELISAVRELAPKASELYSIIYGDGLERADTPEKNGSYLVTDSRYQSIDEIKSAMAEVFSEGYTKVLSNTAFSGVSSDEGAIAAKFTERDGKLYVDPSVTADFGAQREFDLSEIRIVKQNRFKAIVAVKAPDGELEVTLEKDNGVWKLDSAMY